MSELSVNFQNRGNYTTRRDIATSPKAFGDGLYNLWFHRYYVHYRLHGEARFEAGS